MADVAAFLVRPHAMLYAQACERYGVDPARVLADDYLAGQYRVGAGIVATRAERRDREETEAAAPADPFTAAREAAAKVRAMTA